MNLWNIEDLKRCLQQQGSVKDWIVIGESVRRCERYFLSDQGQLAVEQERESNQESILVRLFVKKPQVENRQGEVVKKFARGQPLLPQVQGALSAAIQTDHPTWVLTPPVAQSSGELKSFDPLIVEDIYGAMEQLTRRIEQVVQQVKGAEFNSAELFLSDHNREYHYSNGFVHRLKQTRVYTEAAYSATEGTVSDEFLETRWSVFASDLPVEDIFLSAAKRAQWMLRVQRPSVARLPVLVDAEVLSTLLHGHLSQLSGANRYHALPHLKLGDPFVPGATGDLLSLVLDPEFEGGADTVAFSGEGTPQRRTPLVSANEVVCLSMDAQHGQYLGQYPTVTRGTLVVEPGNRNLQALIGSEPQVLQILQFSGLFADENSGTFSSEIRLALLHDRSTGTVTPIKGGSISGSLSENFQNLRLSSEVIHRVHFETGDISGRGYFGPAWALLSNVSVTG